MPDPKIEVAKNWCEEARKLLNWASLPGTERWNMGTNIVEVGEALAKLELVTKSPALLIRYQTCVAEYENLGNRAKAANAKQDDVAVKVISGELATLALQIKEVEKAVVVDKEVARKKFAATKQAATNEITALKSKNGSGSLVATERGLLQNIVNAAQADFDKGDYVDAMGRFPKFDINLLAAKRLLGERTLKFDAAKKEADAEIKTLEGKNGGSLIATERGLLQNIVNTAQADFDKGDFANAMGRFPTFHADLFTAKKLLGERILKLGTDAVDAVKALAAFTSDPNKTAIALELKAFTDDLDARMLKAKGELTAERFNPASQIAIDGYFEAQRVTGIAARHAAYVAERVKVEGLIAALPTDNAAINKAIGDKAIGDYKAGVAAAKGKGAKNSYDAAMTLLAKAEADCVAAKKIKEDDAAWVVILTEAQRLVDTLPKDNPSIKNDVVALGTRLTAAKELAAVRDYAGAKKIAAEVTTTHGILDKLTKDDAAFTLEAGQAAGKDDTAAAVEALRALWQKLSTRTPADVPKAIKVELDQIDTKLKAVSVELEKPKETTTV